MTPEERIAFLEAELARERARADRLRESLLATARGRGAPPAQEPLFESEPTPIASIGSRPEDLQALWNSLACDTLPRWKEMSDKRRRAARARLSERTLDEWREVIERVNASPFCCGNNDRRWKASPDFLLRPDTAAKVLEGKYDSAKGGPPARFVGWAQKARTEHLQELGRTAEALEDAEYLSAAAVAKDFAFVTRENERALARAFGSYLDDEWGGSHPKRPWPLSHFAKHWDRYLAAVRKEEAGAEEAA